MLISRTKKSKTFFNKMRHIPWYQSWKSRHCWWGLCLNWEVGRSNSCVCVRSQRASLWSIGSPLQAQQRPCEDEGQVEWRAGPRSTEARVLNPMPALSIITGHGPGCLEGQSYHCSSGYPPAAGRLGGKLDDDSELKEGRPCRQEGKWQGSLVCRKF